MNAGQDRGLAGRAPLHQPTEGWLMPSRRSSEALLAWEAQSVRLGYSAEVAGGGDLSSQIARLVGQALRDARIAGATATTWPAPWASISAAW